jgi:hypothetical protein
MPPGQRHIQAHNERATKRCKAKSGLHGIDEKEMLLITLEDQSDASGEIGTMSF